MSALVCRLCLFKSEPFTDEICMEESSVLQEIIDDIFRELIILTKLEIDGICIPCREKLKSFHDYYKFVLENQTKFKQQILINSERETTEFIGFIKEEPPLEIKEEDENFVDYKNDIDSESYEPEKTVKNSKKRSRKSRSEILAQQKQQSDFIGLLFDFNCDYCNSPNFKTFKEILSHCKQKHKRSKIWSCCEKKMTRDLELIEHVMDHKQVWNCKLCREDFEKVLDFWKHKSKHEKILNQSNPIEWLKLQFICHFCGDKFRTRGLIDRHLKDVHIRNYTCYICQEQFYNKKAYANHRRAQHSSIPKFPCPICGVVLKNEARHLSAHMKNTHANQKLVCPTCGKILKNDHAMKVHKIMEHQPKKHKCQYCEKRFKTSNHKKDHEATHSGIPRYFCEICSAAFKSAGNYSAHKRRLHAEEYQKMKMERKLKKYQI